MIRLNNEVKISREGMTTPLVNFLKEELNFTNSEFIIKKKIGRTTFGTERYFKFVEETENEVIVPRGFIGKLIRFCRENKVEYDFVDEQLSIIRNKGRQVFLEKQPENFSRILHDYTDDKKGFIIWKDLLEEQIA